MNRRDFISLIGFAGAASLFARTGQENAQIDSVQPDADNKDVYRYSPQYKETVRINGIEYRILDYD